MSSFTKMGQLKIGVIAPPWVAVPPPLYGGTEVVIDHLCRGFTNAGHDVRLFTTGDSTCAVDRRWLYRDAIGTNGSMLDELGHVQAAYAELADCDVIHDHTLLGPLWAHSHRTPPVVTTVHGEFTPELTELYRRVAQQAWVVAISHHQRSTAPTVPVAAVIHHGIDVERFPIGHGDGGYVVFLGRMHPNKGVDRAIHIARAAGKTILIAAKMWEPAERSYFTETVEPLLGTDAVYLGEVGGQDKHDLLAGAEALVNPIRWPEPFGLVMIESLMAGTPVLAFAEGAAPEIIDDGRTGFICRDHDDMVDRLGEVTALDRAECRADVAARFSMQHMVDQHLALYRRLVTGRQRVPMPAFESARPQADAALVSALATA